MLSEAKDLSADRERPFAFAQGDTPVADDATDEQIDRERPFAALRRDTGDCSTCQGRFVQIEPCLSRSMEHITEKRA
jgi:hypothetical protein